MVTKTVIGLCDLFTGGHTPGDIIRDHNLITYRHVARIINVGIVADFYFFIFIFWGRGQA